VKIRERERERVCVCVSFRGHMKAETETISCLRAKRDERKTPSSPTELCRVMRGTKGLCVHNLTQMYVLETQTTQNLCTARPFKDHKETPTQV